MLETRTRCLEQRIDALIELVNTLVIALGQKADNATPAIPLGIPLANVEGEEGVPPQESGDVAALGDQGTKMEEMCHNYMCPNTPKTRCSIDSHE